MAYTQAGLTNILTQLEPRQPGTKGRLRQLWDDSHHRTKKSPTAKVNGYRAYFQMVPEVGIEPT